MPATAQRRSETTEGRSRRQPDAIALLKNDHAEVAELLDSYEKNKDKWRADRKQKVAAEICKALTVHARIEEEIFYPACDQGVDDAEDLLAEARVEHSTLTMLIGKIEAATPGSEEYDAEVTVLGEYVKHHVKEEQNELFPKVRKSDLDLKELGEQMAGRKSQLMAAK